MKLNVSLERPAPRDRSGPVAVGWFLADDTSSVEMLPPERVRSEGVNKTHAKSASRCPGVIQLESRYFLIRSPYDLHLGLQKTDKGDFALVNRAGGAKRGPELRKFVQFTNPADWRFADRPEVQLKLPYCFVCDEVCYVTQLDAFAHYRPTPLPGTIMGTRHPIHAWAQPLGWGFEWHDTGKDLILKRGDPLFYCQFEADGPDRSVQLNQIERTPEIDQWLTAMKDVSSRLDEAMTLLNAAETLRPENLLASKK